ncbi:hypothetical protein [Gimesia maris]|uniref:hypothetical protein n=1 Tax=Gimesia maris TaxID=122 RepID=UPI00241FF649|nr:hypothetical protein [Gimesia maris]|tara:strand:- start:38617 stop:39117 length:501 start_codon:yes stop_codon:yes gene_type:complete
MKSSDWLLILMMFTFCFVTGVTAEDQRVRLTIPPEQIPDPAWRREYFEGTLPLKNRPQIISRKKVQDEVHVVVKNTGNTTLVYLSAGPDCIQTYQEVFRRGLWRKANWDWCGTGKADYSILPGQSVQLTVRFSDEERGERLLGKFTEAGTNRCGLIVLATETSPDD